MGHARRNERNAAGSDRVFRSGQIEITVSPHDKSKFIFIRVEVGIFLPVKCFGEIGKLADGQKGKVFI